MSTTPSHVRAAALTPAKLTRKELRQARAHLRQAAKDTGSPYAYHYARDGDGELVELRVEGGKFTRTPVDPAGRATGKRRRPWLVSPAWALAGVPVAAAVVELVT